MNTAMLPVLSWRTFTKENCSLQLLENTTPQRGKCSSVGGGGAARDSGCLNLVCAPLVALFKGSFRVIKLNKDIE